LSIFFLKKRQINAFFYGVYSQNVYILTMNHKIGLKIFRKRLGLSQDEIAEKLDCVKTTYQSWENGRREPSIDIIRKLFVLGAKVEELFGIEYNEIHHLIPKYADENFENKVLSKIESLEKKLNEIILSKK